MAATLVSMLVATVLQGQVERHNYARPGTKLRESQERNDQLSDIVEHMREFAQDRMKAERERMLRDWASTSGKYTLRAYFAGEKDGMVYLVKPTTKDLEPGKKPDFVKVKLVDLSKADREWVKTEMDSQLRAQRKAIAQKRRR